MAQYIDKSALLAEIERLKESLLKGACASQISMQANCKEEAYNEILSIINTLEVKDVDLDKEIKDYLRKQPIVARSYKTDFQLVPSPNEIAKHFFELGLKAQKGEKI